METLNIDYLKTYVIKELTRRDYAYYNDHINSKNLALKTVALNNLVRQLAI